MIRKGKEFYFINGGFIRNHLTSVNWTAKKYADDIHMKESQFNNILNGKNRLDLERIDNLCRSFGLTRDEVIKDPEWKVDEEENLSIDDILLEDDEEEVEEKPKEELRGVVAQRLGRNPDFTFGVDPIHLHHDIDKPQPVVKTDSFDEETMGYIHQLMSWKGISRGTRARMMNLIIENWMLKEPNEDA